jgi:hypothetical protein
MEYRARLDLADRIAPHLRFVSAASVTQQQARHQLRRLAID